MRLLCLLPLSIPLVLSGCTTLGTTADQEPALVAPEMAAALDAARGYEFGQSRSALIALEAVAQAALESPEQRGASAALLADYLYSDATWDAKRFACRQLWLLADGGAVDRIAPLLYDSSTSDMARYALEGIPDPAVDAALLEALSLADAESRVGIINSLGARGASSARDTLAEIAEAGETNAQAAAEDALARIEASY